MAIALADVYFIHSGGATNNGATGDQALSFGGDPATATNPKVASQTPAFVTTNLDTAIDFDRASSNQEGNGTMTWDQPNSILYWQGPNAAVASGKVITTDGKYRIGNSQGYLEVDVTVASLPGSSDSDVVSITNVANNTFDDVSAGESLVGLTEYRCYYVRNANGVDIAYDTRVWIGDQPISGLSIEIGFDDLQGETTSSSGLATRVIADEIDSTNQLAGVTFVSPSSYTNGLDFADMAANTYRPFWVKRIVPVDHRGVATPDFSELVLSTFATNQP